MRRCVALVLGTPLTGVTEQRKTWAGCAQPQSLAWVVCSVDVEEKSGPTQQLLADVASAWAKFI